MGESKLGPPPFRQGPTFEKQSQCGPQLVENSCDLNQHGVASDFYVLNLLSIQLTARRRGDSLRWVTGRGFWPGSGPSAEQAGLVTNSDRVGHRDRRARFERTPHERVIPVQTTDRALEPRISRIWNGSAPHGRRYRRSGKSLEIRTFHQFSRACSRHP